MKKVMTLLFSCVIGLIVSNNAMAVTLLGPSAYLCFDGSLAGCGTSFSPFAADVAASNFSYFHLETFEDHLLNTPGVSANNGGVTSVVFGPSIHDSVDGDDGVIDGSGLLGDSFFSSGLPGITFTFDKNVLGAFPTHAGIVWTDGAGTTTFEAFDALGNSLGTVGPNAIADGSVNGETAEDRFYGAINDGGISAIKILNTAGGIEVDHLQYGLFGERTAAVPEPASLLLLGIGSLGLRLRNRKRSV